MNSCRFGQAEGFAKIRERFDEIMGFQKPDLTASVTSVDEKVKVDITDKEKELENEEDKTAEEPQKTFTADTPEVNIITIINSKLCELDVGMRVAELK